jgi:hypothetical protein
LRPHRRRSSRQRRRAKAGIVRAVRLDSRAWTTRSPPARCRSSLGVTKVALNDLAKRGIVKRGEHKGTYALQASVTAYCEHLRSMAAGRGGEAGASARERLGQAQATLAEVEGKAACR